MGILDGFCYSPSCSDPGQCYSPLCNLFAKSNLIYERERNNRDIFSASLKTQLKAGNVEKNPKRFVAVSPKIFRQDRNFQDLLQSSIKLPSVRKRKSMCFDPAFGKSRPHTPIFIPNLYGRKLEPTQGDADADAKSREDDLLGTKNHFGAPAVTRVKKI